MESIGFWCMDRCGLLVYGWMLLVYWWMDYWCMDRCGVLIMDRYMYYWFTDGRMNWWNQWMESMDELLVYGLGGCIYWFMGWVDVSTGLWVVWMYLLVYGLGECNYWLNIGISNIFSIRFSAWKNFRWRIRYSFRSMEFRCIITRGRLNQSNWFCCHGDDDCLFIDEFRKIPLSTCKS